MLKTVAGLVQFVSFWGFITIKVAGVSLAAWSWWWVLLPIVPFAGLLVQHWGL